MVGKVVGSTYHWSSFCFIYWKILKSKTLKYFTLKWYEPTKITACNCLCKIMVRVTTSGSRINFPCMLEPNAFAYSDFHFNDNLFFFIHPPPPFFFIYMKTFKEDRWKKASNICHLRRWSIITKKNPDKSHWTVHSSSSLTPARCECTHNYTVQINSQERFHSSQKIVFQCQGLSPPIMGS